LVQKGRVFKRETDLSLNTSTGQVTVHYTDDEGKRRRLPIASSCPRILQMGSLRR
jgi:hypothetical protein